MAQAATFPMVFHSQITMTFTPSGSPGEANFTFVGTSLASGVSITHCGDQIVISQPGIHVLLIALDLVHAVGSPAAAETGWTPPFPVADPEPTYLTVRLQQAASPYQLLERDTLVAITVANTGVAQTFGLSIQVAYLGLVYAFPDPSIVNLPPDKHYRVGSVISTKKRESEVAGREQREDT